MGVDVGFYAWLYPPTAFIFVWPFGLLPYLHALVFWIVASAAPYFSALWRLLPDRRALLPMAAFPGVVLTIGHGQNSMLSAAMLTWGMLMLRRRPRTAGAVLGLLVYKPQLGILLPVALMATRNWRAFISTALSAVTVTMASYLLVGRTVWTAYLDQSGFSVRVLEDGLVAWEKMVSAFAAARLVGMPTDVAWIGQVVVTVLVATAIWLVWASPAAFEVKAAALAVGTMLATPFALDYEATFLGVAIAAFVAHGLEHGFLPWEKSVLAVAWSSPLLWRILALGTGLPLAFPTLTIVLLLIMRRWQVDMRVASRPHMVR